MNEREYLIREICNPSLLDCVSAGANIKIPWKCNDCGCLSTARVDNRCSILHPSGCPECASSRGEKNYIKYTHGKQDQTSKNCYTSKKDE